MIKLRNKYVLDERDEAIIRLLSTDGRTSLSDLAVPLGITRVAVGGRIKRMEQHGVIKGYTVVIDWDKVVAAEEIMEALGVYDQGDNQEA